MAGIVIYMVLIEKSNPSGGKLLMTINTTSITPTRLLTVLKPLWEEKLAPFLHGSPGIGKSAIIWQFAALYNLKVIDLRLTQIEAADLRGLPYIDSDTKRTVWFLPEFLPRAEEVISSVNPATGKPYDGVIIFLDELTAAEPRLQASAYELILDRRVGTYKLPDSVWVVGAGNSPDDGAIAYEFGTALADRLVHFKVVSNPQEWLVWGEENDIADEVLSFIRVKPDHLDSSAGITSLTASGNRGGQNVGDKLIVPTPRSWFRVSRMIKKNLPKDTLEYIVSGIVGDSSCAEFFHVLEELDGLAPISDILKASDKELLKLLPPKVAAMCGLAYSMPAFCETVDDFRRAINVFNILSEMDDTPSRAEIQTLAMSLLFKKVSAKTRIDKHFLQKVGTSKEYAIYREKTKDIIELFGAQL